VVDKNQAVTGGTYNVAKLRKPKFHVTRVAQTDRQEFCYVRHSRKGTLHVLI
jgi:hypothetical protein